MVDDVLSDEPRVPKFLGGRQFIGMYDTAKNFILYSFFFRQ